MRDAGGTLAEATAVTCWGWKEMLLEVWGKLAFSCVVVRCLWSLHGTLVYCQLALAVLYMTYG